MEEVALLAFGGRSMFLEVGLMVEMGDRVEMYLFERSQGNICLGPSGISVAFMLRMVGKDKGVRRQDVQGKILSSMCH